MGYNLLGISYANLGDRSLASENLQKAFGPKTFPRDWGPHNALGFIYAHFGEYDQVLLQDREALRALPDSGQHYSNVVFAYL